MERHDTCATSGHGLHWPIPYFGQFYFGQFYFGQVSPGQNVGLWVFGVSAFFGLKNLAKTQKH